MPGPINVLLKTAHGVVLDVGPGSGEQLSRFDPAKIGVMHGAEPNIHLLPGLLRIAEKVGFDRKYRALQCGGEPESLIPALAKAGALKDGASRGVFDDIVYQGALRSAEAGRDYSGLISAFEAGREAHRLRTLSESLERRNWEFSGSDISGNICVVRLEFLAGGLQY